MLVAAAVAFKLRGVLVPPAEALIRGIPIAPPQALILTDLPGARGPRILLFNGADLNDWDGWLGYSDPSETYRYFHSAGPIGAGGIGNDFKVVVEDGEPAIYVKGKTWGSLTHKGDYGDYRVSNSNGARTATTPCCNPKTAGCCTIPMARQEPC